MRKSMMAADGGKQPGTVDWLDLEKIARVEISSEDELFPIEHALAGGAGTGWRAAAPGAQVVRLRFDEPVDLHAIQVHIVERAAERMQEFTIKAEMTGTGVQEVVRQQFTFSPHGSTEEIEQYGVALKAVEMLELRIDPDRAHDPGCSQSYATLAALRLG